MFQRNAYSVAILLLVVLLTWLRAGSPSPTSLGQDLRDFVADLSQPAPPPGARLFSRDEIHGFLVQAATADAIVDPLQRCLAYPDPPGSHWSPAAVKAYCTYSFQNLMSFAEVKALVDGGHADELDQRMRRMLEQQGKPGSSGLLDHVYLQDFYTGSPDIRPTLDAWKRASPQSAFAFAASGVAYVKMASDARGDDTPGATVRGQLRRMGDLLQKADVDLQKAVSLDPRLTPAYVAMVKAGHMYFGRRYMLDAASHGLAVSPDDYGIFAARMLAEQPQWRGSMGLMQRLTVTAQTRAAQNPMLTLLKAEVPAYHYDVCNCRRRAVWTADPVVFDQLADVSRMQKAAYAARAHKYYNLSAIYLSEVMRFTPDANELRIDRNYDVVSLGELPWALADADAIVNAAPEHADRLDVRGNVYEAMKDYPHAVADFLASIKLDPHQTWPLIELGRIYVYATHDWAAGWSVADQLIQKHPEKAQGWILRASIQKDQPRAGLDDTIHYFLDHFGDDPAQQVTVREMRAALASEASKKSAAAAHG